MLLGTGNVATHLFNAFQKAKNIDVVQVYNRNKKGLSLFQKHTKTTTHLSKLITADVYIIAISDDAITRFSESLPLKNKLVVHTSGSIPLENLSKHNSQGVFYPLQTFTKGEDIDFLNIPICIEASSAENEKMLVLLAESISENVNLINSKQRKALHIAAVFVNNFVNHLYTIGEDICDTNQVSFDILKPLIQETANKIVNLSPTKCQTGPAKRNDKKVIDSHLLALQSKNKEEIYKLITQSITKKYGNKL